jgi:hypothetical protein
MLYKKLLKLKEDTRSITDLEAAIDHQILLQGLKRCIWLHPSYLLTTIVAILAIKLMSATFLQRISFVIIVGKREIRKLFVLPSSRNGSNSDYHNKIC